MVKRCCRCGATKPLDSFYRDRTRRDGRMSRCRDCHNAGTKPSVRDPASRNAYARKKWADMSRDERWERELKRMHGMYPWQWQAMWDEQDGMCYLGLHPLPDARRRVAIDHDHNHCPPDKSCGVCRRGLACSNCNSGIGLFGEDPARMRIAADRLEQANILLISRLPTSHQVELDL